MATHKSKVKAYTDGQILARVKALGSYKSIPSGYWICGIRSNEDDPDFFDDKFYLFQGEKFILVTSGTTHPGLSILKGGYKSYNAVGAAVLKADEWYYDVWKYGLHRGKMKALLQLGAKVKYYRDGDQDLKAEEVGMLLEGYIGINFHTNTYALDSKTIKEKIGAWSAGCQVCNIVPDYLEIIDKCKTQKGVSYCLLNEW
jgi:hypothetical protein